MFKTRYSIFILVILGITSCINRKQIAYFQKTGSQSDTITAADIYIPKIEHGDLLMITVSSLNSTASSFFNPYSNTPIAQENNSDGASPSVALGTQSNAPGFLVDSSGFIEMPIIGSVKVGGCTTGEAKLLIKDLLKRFLKEPTVNVRYLNYKVSVLGEVNKPGVYLIPNEQVTLTEAISLAGDLTIFGRRENILVVRTENGKKEFGRVNLNNRDVYKSRFYYLHNHDEIYVEPGKGKIAQSDKTYQVVPIIISTLSLISIILLYLKR